jgi:hypothetical protein
MIEAEVDGIEVLIRYHRLLAILFYPTLLLFEQANCIDWINFCYILSLTDIYIAFSGTPATRYLLSFGNLTVNPVRRRCECMVIGFTTTYAISVYHY